MALTAEKIEMSDSLKLTVERTPFLKALGRLQSIVERRNTIPILSNIKLETLDGQLFMTATDTDISATESTEADITSSSAVTVPAQTLYDIIRKLPEGSQIALESDGSTTQLHVEAGKAKFALSYLPAAEFPVLSEGDMTHTFTLTGEEALFLIDKARFAMSTEETRYYLNGVYLHTATSDSGDPTLRAVATDGHRLARIEMALPAGADNMPGIIIPRKAVNELRKMLEDSPASVEIALSETKIRFSAGNITVISKLIDGTFPDYERVIPSDNNKIMETDTKLFSQAVDRVSTISTDKTKAIKVELESGKMILSAHSPDSGTASEEIEVTYSADNLDIGFNSRYLLDMLSELDLGSAQFIFSDSASPVLVRDPAKAGALYVIMPMRV